MARIKSGAVINRRALLATSLGGTVALVTACRSGDPTPGELPSASAPRSPAPSPAVQADPALTSAIAAVAAQRGYVAAIQRAFPRLGVRYVSLLEIHDAHLQFLAGLPGASAPKSLPDIADLPESRAVSDRAVASATTQLAASLATLAIKTQDGSLARSLASLSAGVAQRGSTLGWARTFVNPELPASATLTELEISGLQISLARAHAGLWSYGVLGGRTSATRSPTLFAAIRAGYAANRMSRDQLSTLLLTVGAVPVAALSTYPPMAPLDSPLQIAEAAQTLEHASAATASWLVAQTQGEVRAWATASLVNAAIRELAVQGTPQKLPGADELADR